MAPGKKRGPEDDRTQPWRFHDALQECCELLMAACWTMLAFSYNALSWENSSEWVR
jgi:hypothetical protein